MFISYRLAGALSAVLVARVVGRVVLRDRAGRYRSTTWDAMLCDSEQVHGRHLRRDDQGWLHETGVAGHWDLRELSRVEDWSRPACPDLTDPILATGDHA